MLSKILDNIVEPAISLQSGVTMPNNIVDNIKQLNVGSKTVLNPVGLHAPNFLLFTQLC